MGWMVDCAPISGTSLSPRQYLPSKIRLGTVVKGLASEPGHRGLQNPGSVWSRIRSFGIHWRLGFSHKSNILQVPRLGRTLLRAACVRAQACLVHKEAFDTGILSALSR